MTMAFRHQSGSSWRQEEWFQERARGGIKKAALMRSTLGTLALIMGVLIVAACAPAQQPEQSAERAATPVSKSAAKEAAKPSATVAAKPTTKEATKPAAKEAAKPAASAEWKAEWDKVLAAAKKEGKVAVAGPQGEGYRNALEPFRKAFPDIEFELSQVSGSAWAGKVSGERQAGMYLWDVYLGGGSTALLQFIPDGWLDPLPPTFILPEVADESKWFGGFKAAFKDEGRELLFAVEAREQHKFWVNRDFVSKAELNSVEDLLFNPKWKGKIAVGDPRSAGTPNAAMANILRVYGEDALRKFIVQQDPVVTPDDRMLLDNMVRGTHPIAIGVNPVNVLDYQSQGTGLKVELLEPYHPACVTLGSGRSNLALMNKAPHPNAAKVFINWYLSSEGQRLHVEHTMNNSRRVDVDPPPDSERRPDFSYYEEDWSDMHYKDTALKIAKELIK